MGCRVGMSTKPEERIQYWKRKEGHTDSKILACGLTYEKAQEMEAFEAEMKGCQSSGGGERVDGVAWCVYCVWGGTIPRSDASA